MDDATFQKLTRDLARVLERYEIPAECPIRVTRRDDWPVSYYHFRIQRGIRIMTNAIALDKHHTL